jgi:hypothetical protein
MSGIFQSNIVGGTCDVQGSAFVSRQGDLDIADKALFCVSVLPPVGPIG